MPASSGEYYVVPKMKSHSGTKSRVWVTGTGKYMRAKGSRRHLKAHKSKRVLRMDEQKFEVSPVYTKKLKRLLPYGVS